jgi:competence protein ComEC
MFSSILFGIVHHQRAYAGHPGPDDLSSLQVHFLGISEGESTLIQLPDGYTLLVDAGSQKSGNEVVRLLHERNIEKIDTLILTGPMDDHIGGAIALLGSIPTDRILVPEPTKQGITNKIKLSRELVTSKEGQRFSFPSGVELKILHPGEPLSLLPKGNSLVFQLVHHKVKFLFTSDVNDETELKLMNKYDVKSQILKVSDSGSNEASHAKFLEEVDAHVAILFHDDKHRPNDGVIARLTESWMDVYQTENDGTITVISNGRDYQIQKENPKGYFQKGYFKEGKEQGSD